MDELVQFVEFMLLSRESEYGLEGLAVLAQRPRGTVMVLQEIARAGGLPVGFLARIFQKLRRHKLVASHRGAVRGYALARLPRQIALLEIVEAIEGPSFFDRCIFRPRHCDQREPCRVHDSWTALSASLRRTMQRTTLEDVVGGGPRRRRHGGS